MEALPSDLDTICPNLSHLSLFLYGQLCEQFRPKPGVGGGGGGLRLNGAPAWTSFFEKHFLCSFQTFLQTAVQL